jgi:hypothetical protein
MDIPIFKNWPIAAQIYTVLNDVKLPVIFASDPEDLAQQIEQQQAALDVLNNEAYSINFFEFSTSLEKRITWEKPTP